MRVDRTGFGIGQVLDRYGGILGTAVGLVNKQNKIQVILNHAFLKQDKQAIPLSFPYTRLRWLVLNETGNGIAQILNEYEQSIGVAIGRPESPEAIRSYTPDEWHAFVDGAKNREFDAYFPTAELD